MAVARATVTITEPGLAGSYVVAEQRPDGSLVLEPETIDQVVEKFADRTLTENEQEEMFARLAAASDRARTAPA